MRYNFLGIKVVTMDLPSSRGLTQRQKDHIYNSVWETIKHCIASIEVEDEDSDNNLFYMLPSSPLKPIFDELEIHLKVDQARRQSCTIFNVHSDTYNQLVHPQNVLFLRPRSRYTLNPSSWHAPLDLF